MHTTDFLKVFEEVGTSAGGGQRDLSLASAGPWKGYKSIWTPILQEAIIQLKPSKVGIPWLPIVAEAFPGNEAKSMREWVFFRSFMESITLLFQYQLPHVVFYDVEHVAALPLILERTLLIGEAAFRGTITGLEKDLSEFYEHLRKRSQEQWTRTAENDP